MARGAEEVPFREEETREEGDDSPKEDCDANAERRRRRRGGTEDVERRRRGVDGETEDSEQRY